MLAQAKASAKRVYKNLEQKQEEDVQGDLSMAGYDPVASYVAELQAEFGHLALFFYDAHGGQHIGVMFNPDALKSCELRVPDFADRMPHGSKVRGWKWGSETGVQKRRKVDRRFLQTHLTFFSSHALCSFSSTRPILSQRWRHSARGWSRRSTYRTCPLPSRV